MAPYSASRSAPTTPQSHVNPRTPSSASKHRPVSLINRLVTQSPCPPQPPPSSDHPVEVVARIRDHPDSSDNLSVLQVTQNGQTVRIRTDQGYRDFGLDGVSLAEAEDLHSFYKKYIESRIESVKTGGRCTIMMYGPTGAGKSHTMFGSAKEPGIAYRALQNILGGSSRVDEKYGSGSPDYSLKKTKITVSILEIYNEDIFDLLAGSNTPNGRWIRPQLSRVRLEVMGKKAKNAVSITGTDAEKIAKEIAKVEKRRVVKSTSCNERSSRSHCVVMLDIPALGGRLVLVDMAGSENLEQAGLGMDSKMQTGKINQGNIALKRVVEAIANGDSYIPFRDSKLTMLLQDSFEDDESKILMILCASPDPKDMHKTIATLEYGCKAKCIVSLPKSPAKERLNNLDRMDLSVLEARVRAMDAHIAKLEAENQSKDKEKDEIVKKLQQKEKDFAALKSSLEQMEQEPKERCSNCSIDAIRVEMESRVEECQKAAEEVIAVGKKKLEEKVAEQQREIECMRSRMKEIESEVELFLKAIPEFSHALCNSGIGDVGIVGKVRGLLKGIDATNNENPEKQLPSSLHNNLLKIDESTESIKGGEVVVMKNRDVDNNGGPAQQPCQSRENSTFKSSVAQDDLYANREGVYDPNGWLPIIPEEESEGEVEMMADDDEDHYHKLQSVLSLEKTGQSTFPTADHEAFHHIQMDIDDCSEGNVFDRPSENCMGLSVKNTLSGHADIHSTGDSEGEEAAPVSATSRRSRIENIFLLCGNHRELAAANTQKQPHETTCHHESTHALDQGSAGALSIDDQLGSHIADIGEGSFVGLAANSPAKLKASPLKFKDSSGSKAMKGADKSPAHFISSKTRHPFSENTPPRGILSSYSSPLSTSSISHYTKSPTMNSFGDSLSSANEANAEKNSSQFNSETCEVYVKWETSKESSGKLISILTTKRSSSLAELRRDLEKHVAGLTQDFAFLMLGDPSGAPVERENESHLQVMSLPNCHKQRGTKLACLRPLLKRNTESQGPLCPLENQMSWNTSKAVTPSPRKSPLGFNLRRPVDKASEAYQGENPQKTNQRLSFPLITQVKGLRL